MCYFKKLSDEETDDEDTVTEEFLFRNMGAANFEENPSSDETTDNEAAREPVAGPSTSRGEPQEIMSDNDNEGVTDMSSASEEEDEDLDDEDPVVQAIKEAKIRPKVHPPDIKFSDDVSNLSFHPGGDVVAVASVTGDIFVYKYDLDSCELTQTIEAHSKSCRDVEFAEDGRFIASCGKENSIMITDAATGKLLQFYDSAHENNDVPYSLYVFSENLICSGGESGSLKVWDIRQKQSVCRFKVGDDLVSSMVSDDGEKYLVCTAGDSISSYDMSARKLFIHSEAYDDDLTSLQIFKQGTKLVVGGVKGSLYVFNWGQFGYHSDVYPAPKHSINSMVAITENIVLTGCEDGVLRAAHLFPHKQLGVVGQHKHSIEATDISHDGLYIASLGFDDIVKFWDISYFEDIHVKPEKSKKRDSHNNLPSSQVRNPGDFFAGMT